MPFIPQKRSREFEVLYESPVVNYSSMSRDEVEYQRPCILYVLPNNIGNLLGTVEELMDWKKEWDMMCNIFRLPMWSAIEITKRLY